MTTITTYSFRVKDSSKKKHLDRMARSVNFIWNYCNEAHYESLRRGNGFISKFGFSKMTSGTSKDLNLHSQTVQAVGEEFWKKAFQFKKRKLKWRGRKSLGWIPFKVSGIKINDDTIKFSGITFRFWKSREIDGKVKCGSFSQDARGRWYINITCETEFKALPKTNKSIGIDLGLKNLAALSDGTVIDGEKPYRRFEEKLGKAQRAKKFKQAKKIHAKIKNLRKDFLHKFSTELIELFDTIIVGNVSSSKLAKTKMAKSIYDAGWASLKTMLRYKAIRLGKKFLEVNEAFSTITYSNCLERTGPTGLSGLNIRKWQCSHCLSIHNRDTNAATNIFRIGHDTLTLKAS